MPGLSDTCGVCLQNFQFSLPRCGFCRKAVCATCGQRVGGAMFCGRACGHNFFYGADEDVEEEGSKHFDDEDE